MFQTQPWFGTKFRPTNTHTHTHAHTHTRARARAHTELIWSFAIVCTDGTVVLYKVSSRSHLGFSIDRLAIRLRDIYIYTYILKPVVLIPLWQTEPWFGTKYRLAQISDDQFSAWRSAYDATDGAPHGFAIFICIYIYICIYLYMYIYYIYIYIYIYIYMHTY